MEYLITENKELVQASGDAFKEITCVVGQDYWVDGIQVVCIRAGNALAMDNIYLIDGPHGGDVPIFIDKNHDLSYYCSGSDFLNVVESTTVIDSTAKYSYEWGGYGIETGVTAEEVGTGLENTNTLIGMNLQPNTSGWWVVWDKVQDFRASYGHKWFIPSISELGLAFLYKDVLNNLSTSESCNYWSSSESSSSNYARFWGFKFGGRGSDYKNKHDTRIRLCRQIDN